MASQIKKFLKEEEKSATVQGHVPESLYAQTNAVRKKLELTWDELLEATFKRLVSEEK